MCPHLDFNGAGLLYFSSFIAAVDRAEWRSSANGPASSRLKGVQARFHANIEVGDDITVQMFAAQDGAGCRHRAILSASVVGKLLPKW